QWTDGTEFQENKHTCLDESWGFLERNDDLLKSSEFKDYVSSKEFKVNTVSQIALFYSQTHIIYNAKFNYI
ncbi:hypothetical protein BB560_004125, partial [Smittium megazygosporum]